MCPTSEDKATTLSAMLRSTENTHWEQGEEEAVKEAEKN
jgi:hypothetical protein